jgi:hypothetical protein
MVQVTRFVSFGVLLAEVTLDLLILGRSRPSTSLVSSRLASLIAVLCRVLSNKLSSFSLSRATCERATVCFPVRLQVFLQTFAPLQGSCESEDRFDTALEGWTRENQYDVLITIRTKQLLFLRLELDTSSLKPGVTDDYTIHRKFPKKTFIFVQSTDTSC